jgi:hypothetical protein
MKIEFGFSGILLFITMIGFVLMMVGGILPFIACKSMPQWHTCTSSWLPQKALDVLGWVFWIGAGTISAGILISIVYTYTRPTNPSEEKKD